MFPFLLCALFLFKKINYLKEKLNPNQLNKIESYSLVDTKTPGLKTISDEEFIQWFVGLTDGEGCFSIVPSNNDTSFYFKFAIFMHNLNHSFITEHLSSVTRKLNHKMQLMQSRSYSTYIKPISNTEISYNLNPWFVTGYADGESSFILLINKNNKSKIGYSLQGSFSINIHEKDRVTLEKIAKFFGVGNITKSGKESILYRVTSVKDLINVIIPHFDKYPLLTQKYADYLLFKKAIELMYEKKHLNIEGFEKIISIKASLNLGLTDDLKITFPEISAISRPLVQLPKQIDPNWVAGFTSGEGNFGVNIVKSSSTKIGERVSLIFRITQHTRDTELMKCLISFFGCGMNYKVTNRELGNYTVNKFSDITGKIIPFFEKYCIEGVKAEDFRDFCQVAKIIESKSHLTTEGLENIHILKSKMNRSRSRSNTDVNIFNKDGNLVYTFNSIKECALFFKVSERTIIRRLIKGSLVEYENQNLIFKNNI